jgi:tetratricopeptide (TPR) repeat protein
LAAFRRLLRKDPAVARVCCTETQDLAESIDRAIGVSLFRLPTRMRAVVSRYDLQHESVDRICLDVGLSRRQFFRDHRAALLKLAAFVVGEDEYASDYAGAIRGRPAVSSENEPAVSGSTATCLAIGLHNVGGYAEALRVLRQERENVKRSIPYRIAVAIDTAEIAVEGGAIAIAQSELQWIDSVCKSENRTLDRSVVAQCELVAGDLEPSHAKKQQRYQQALEVLNKASAFGEEGRRRSRLLAKTLHALSLSHDHQGEWSAARNAAREAVNVIERSQLADSPIGLFVRANYVMRDARQYGNVDVALEKLWICLKIALSRGWIPVVGDIAVQFINLNLMCLQYEQALRWRRWIARIDSSRLTARTTNFLAVDTAHALTMLGRPRLALAVVEAEGDEGLAFFGAREYWRSDALRAAGEATSALELAARALEQATAAGSSKGRARCQRVLASCHSALGHRRVARKAAAECMELSEWFVSPYDLLLSMKMARELDRCYDRDEWRLAELLRGRCSAAAFDPPSV